MSSIIDYIRDVIKKYDPFVDERINVDYIGEEMTYSIDPLPCDPVLANYVDGGQKKQFQFAFMSKEQYDEDARVNINNSGFFSDFEEWLSQWGKWKSPFPDMEEKKIPVKFETLNKGYLYDVNGHLAQYRMECRLIYTQEV